MPGKHSTPNWADKQGARWNVGGTLRVQSSGAVTLNGTETVNGRLTIGSSGLFEWPVEAGTTAANFSNTGLTHFGNSTGKTYTLDKPTQTGQVKFLVCTQGSTNTKQTVQVATTGAPLVGPTSNKTKISFTAADQAVCLVARGTTRWDVVGQRGSSLIVLTT